MRGKLSIAKIGEGVDIISEWAGRLSSVLVLTLIILLVYEVAVRYILNSPTSWSFDISYMVGGAAMVLGTAVALKERKHVRVDIFYDKWSSRVQAVVDIVMAVILFFPLMAMGLYVSFGQATLSLERGERIMSGIWNPPIYPLKIVIAIAIALFLLQGFVELLRNIAQARTGGD